ncbi:DUF523 domain-containing protein [Dethiothermospora halolimnae]|uniref:DUF523 domain-containing protein n=1 Tax=Dethiothermospora halolimnae TaxID=3114390 RepID=UPI003CCBC90D
MYIVSACLAGISCRYDGKHNLNKDILNLLKEGKAILVCPEQLGGLSTPRVPCEIKKDSEGNIKVINKEGKDVTENFIKGAKETLKIAKDVDATIAILKSRSPSCGYKEIYDGTFSGKRIKGNGITGELLSKEGIKIYNEDNIPKEILDK